MTGSPSRRGVVGGALMLGGLAATRVGAWAAEGQTPPLAVPPPAPPRPPVIVDAEGVMRWGPAGEEVAVFGVNYCLPSASAYRYARAAGADLHRTVVQDLDHLKRLGQDAIRLSFWGDYEVTERNGDLIENDHLRLLDRVVAEASARGMAMLLSPIVTYNANWPDALDQPVRGIGGAFEKGELGLNPAAIAAQVNYLTQLLSRPSALTGRRLADEPWLIAVEPVNEPWHHPEEPEKSVAYINALMKAVRDAGCALPVFHNVTQDQRVAADIARSDMQGGTFAWYPTGLQGGHEIEGNHLLLVEQYDAMRDARLSGKARLVYEFDAADTMATYMLPAMARTFRAGGAQFAAYFTYDPLPIAAANLEFNDHFLNLAYTPGKAISLMIAAEVFRRWPRRQGFGAYPRSMRFGPFRVDDEADLSEMVTETEYLHSHDTATVPPAPERLERLAGVGSSPLVGYEGTGAWFLDRLQPGEWRLEILADAAVIANPFDRRHPDRPVARVVHRPRIIEIALPDLGNDYAIEGTDGAVTARAGQAIVTPGVYRLRRAGLVAAPAVLTAGVVQPVASSGPALILFEPPRRLVAGQDVTLRAQLIADRTLPVTVRLETASGETQVALTPGIGFDVAARVADEGIRPGPLSGVIEAAGAQPVRFETTVVEASAGGLLFDAALDQARMIVPYGGYQPFPQAVFVQDGRLGGAALRLNGEDLTADENADLSVQFPVRSDWTRTQATALRLSARSAKGRDARLTVVLIERDGMAWGLPIALGQNGVEVALSSAVPVQAVMLPRDFPKGVNPPWFRRPAGRGGPQDRLDPAAIRALQFVLAGRFFAQGDDTRPEVLIQRLEIV